MESKFKKISIILGVAVIILLMFVIFFQGKKYGANQSPNSTVDPASLSGSSVISPTKTLAEANAELDANPALKNAQVEAPDANPILNNIVVTPEGEPTVNSSTPMSPNAPQQTPSISKDQLSDKVIQLDISSAGFSPSQFTVKAGEAVTVAVTATDELTHLFQFNDPALYAVRVLVGNQATRAITFNAPVQAGEYTFRCGEAGHDQEIGIMIVK